MNIQCFINMLCKYNKKELEDKLHFIFYDIAGGKGGVQCWLDLYRKEYKEIYGIKPNNSELLKYISL